MPEAKTAINVRKPTETVAVMDIEGEISAFSESVMTAAQEEANDGATKALVLNFNELEYMNSGGIGQLVTMLIRANRQGQRMAAFGLNEHYQQIFQLTRLDEAISIYENEADALSAVAG